MKGYVARKGNRYYAVIYEGVDQLTGRERRRWHPARLDPVQAEALAAQLASEHDRGRGGQRHSLTLVRVLEVELEHRGRKRSRRANAVGELGDPPEQRGRRSVLQASCG